MGVITCHEGGDGINAVMGNLAPIAFVPADQLELLPVSHRIHRGATIDGVSHCLHYLWISAETQRRDSAAVAIAIHNDGIRIGSQPYLLARIKIAQFDQFTFCHSCAFSFLWAQKRPQYPWVICGLSVSISNFPGRNCLAEGILAPFLHRAILKCSALECSDLKYKGIVAFF